MSDKNTGIYLETSEHTGQTYILTSEETRPVSVGELLAVAKYGVEETEGKYVHHYNTIKWDNRPKNITLVENKDELYKKSYWKMVDGEPQLHHHDGKISDLAKKYD